MGANTEIRPSTTEVLSLLEEGNKRFVTGNLQHPDHSGEVTFFKT